MAVSTRTRVANIRRQVNQWKKVWNPSTETTREMVVDVLTELRYIAENEQFDFAAALDISRAHFDARD